MSPERVRHMLLSEAEKEKKSKNNNSSNSNSNKKTERKATDYNSPQIVAWRPASCFEGMESTVIIVFNSSNTQNSTFWGSWF